MIELSRRSGIVIPKEYENESWFHLVRSHLFRHQRMYNSPLMESHKYFSESEKFLTIPRYFPIHEYINDVKIIDNTHEGKDININHDINPRNAAQQNTIDFMLNNNRGLIKLNPGMGKTVISIYVIATRKKKTFVLVHRDGLVKQWAERLKQFTDISNDDIAILNSSKFEKQLLDSSIILATAQTVISLLQRKPIEYLTTLNKANIGIFIGDEVHTSVGAPTFSNCSLHMPSKYTWGLSATPLRTDGNSDIIKYHLGELFEIDSDEDTMPAEITFILMDFNIDNGTRDGYLHWEGNFQRSRYLNIMKNSPVFMNLTKALIMKLVKDDRNSLIIAERVPKLIEPLFDWLDYEDKSKFISGSELSELEYKITFSTPGKIRDGIDAQWKDSLLITSPVSNIEQLSGRITRSYKGHDKKTPIILDMVDVGCERIRSSFISRNDFYKNKGWKINYMFVNQLTGEKFNIRETDAFTIVNGG